MLAYTDFKEKKVLPDNAPMRVYGVLGDGFLQKRVIAALLDWILPEDVRDFNLDTLDGVSTSLTEVLARCGNLPFLADARVILVQRAERLEGFGRGGDDDGDEDGEEAKPKATPEKAKGGKKAATTEGASEKRFIESIKSLPASTVLILSRSAESFDPAARKKTPRCINARVDKAIETPLKNGVKKAVALGLIVDCSLNARSADFAITLLNSEAARHGIPLASDAARHMVERVGINIELLVNEMEKCALRAGWGEMVTVGIVDEMVRPNLQDTIFSLTDAMGARNTPHTLGLLRELLNAGNAPERILATLIPHLRQLLQMRALLDAGVRVTPRMADDVPAKLAIQLPQENNLPALAATPMMWKVRKLGDQARNFTSEQIQNALQAALAADLAMKGISADITGEAEGGTPELLLELAVLSFGQ